MKEKLKRVFLYNGFEPNEIRGIRYKLVDVTVDNFKKLAMGMGMLYMAAIIFERKWQYIQIDLIYLACFTVFLLLINFFKHSDNYKIAEFAVVFIVMGTLSIAIYDSTYASVESRGVFYPVFLVIFAVMFTGNPIGIDVIMFLMTAAFLLTSYHVKNTEYFMQDAFTALFCYLISNMMNAMVARSRIKTILKTDEVTNSEKRYKTLYENLPCGIVEYIYKDGKLQFTRVNDLMAELLDYEPEHVNYEEFRPLSQFIQDQDMKQGMQVLNTLTEVGNRYKYEICMKKRTQGTLWVTGNIYVQGIDEEGVHILSSVINIDERKKAEDASEAKSKFLSRMSHEIRTPINAILGITQLQRQDILEGKYESSNLLSYAEETKTASKYLLTLVNDILDTSRIETNNVELNYGPLVAEEFLQGIVSLMQSIAAEKKVKFVCERKTHFRKAYITDEVRGQQILLNLLNNAMKFTPAGGKVTLMAEAIAETDKETTLQFTVEDNGIGMTEEFQKKLFHPFMQENDGNTSPFEGTGLGLSISRELARLMGGDIICESVKGSGTRFIVTVVVGNVADEEVVEKPQENLQEEYSFQGVNILLCEDHPLNQKIAKTLLERALANVVVAADGVEGVNQFDQSEEGFYQVILMDIRMPNMDGLQATRTIRELNRKDAKTIPIIAMSANAYKEDVDKSLAAGMNAHLAKPVDTKLMYRTIQQYISK